MKITQFGSITMVGDDLNFTNFDFDSEGSHFDTEQEMWRAMVITIARLMLEKAHEPFVHAAPPVVAGSVDISEIDKLLVEYAVASVCASRGGSKEDHHAITVKFIKVIDAYGTQQREAGYHEGVEQLRHERDGLLVLVIEAQDRAEKAEADLKQANEWRAAALEENTQSSERWAKRVAELEAQLAAAKPYDLKA